MHDLAIWLVERYRLSRFLLSLFLHRLLDSPPPVIVYQMGKVGSSSVIATIKSTGRPVYQVHRANEESIKNLRKWTDNAGMPRRVEEPGRFLGKCWSKGKLIDLPLIVLLREPLQRNLSAFFQNGDYFMRDIDVNSDVDVTQKLERFIEEYNHRQPLDWLESELLNFFPETLIGSDDFLIESNICLIRSEVADSLKLECLNKFLGTELTKICRANDANQKDYRGAYNQLSSLARADSRVIAKYREIYTNTIFQDYR